MLRYITVLLLVITFGMGENGYKQHKELMKQLANLTADQYEVLMYGLKAGKKDDLSYTLAAVSWKESSFGVHVVNHKDGELGSYGAYQNLITTVLKRTGLSKESELDVVLIKTLLINSLSLGSNLALEELKYWKKVHKNDYTKMLASYNAGWASDKSHQGANYAKAIKARVKALKAYIRHNKIIF